MVVDGQDDETEEQPASRARSRVVENSIRQVIGDLALELATRPPGRAVGLMVEVEPHGGVELGTRGGHRLYLEIEGDDRRWWIAWTEVDPERPGERPQERQGRLGEGLLDEQELRACMARWLARCSR